MKSYLKIHLLPSWYLEYLLKFDKEYYSYLKKMLYSFPLYHKSNVTIETAYGTHVDLIYKITISTLTTDSLSEIYITKNILNYKLKT